MTCRHNAHETSPIAGDTVAEVTLVWFSLELLFGVSAPPVPWGDEKRQCVCTALMQSAPVHAACLLCPFWHIPPPWRDRVQFSTLSQVIIISATALWWELALRRVLWLQEAQQDAPDDTLCYFSCAFLVCSVKADWCICPSQNPWTHSLAVVQMLTLSLYFLASHSTALQFKHLLNP